MPKLNSAKLNLSSQYVLQQVLLNCKPIMKAELFAVNILSQAINSLQIKSSEQYLKCIRSNLENGRMKSYQSIDMLNRGFLINLDDEKTDKNPTGQFQLPDLNNDVDIQWVGDNTQHEGFTDEEIFGFE